MTLPLTHEEKLTLARSRYGRPFAHEVRITRTRPKSNWLIEQERRSQEVKGKKYAA